jgi:flavin-binding protein dodecin
MRRDEEVISTLQDNQDASKALHDLRVAEVVKQDSHLDEGGGLTFRTKLQLAFKYEREH